MDCKATVTFHYPPSGAGSRTNPRFHDGPAAGDAGQDHVIDIRDRKGEQHGGRSAARERLTQRAVQISQRQGVLSALMDRPHALEMRRGCTLAFGGVLSLVSGMAGVVMVDGPHLGVSAALLAVGAVGGTAVYIRNSVDAQAEDDARAEARTRIPQLAREIRDLGALQRRDTYSALLESRLPADLVENVVTFLSPAHPFDESATAPPV